jgi:sugar lactone lactonase YvrE
MTHIQEVIRLEPSGTVVAGQVVRVRRETDGTTIAAGVTDANGEVEYIVDGHPGPYYLHVEDIPGGDKYWHSYDATGAGALTFPEIPYALRTMGDGVIPGYENELAVSVTGSSTLSMASGACIAAGHVVVNYIVDNLTVSRPASITRLDRLVCRLYPDTASVTPGKAEFGLLAGNTDGTAVDLTQNSEVYEVGLGVVTVPVAAPISFSDSRSFAGLGSSPVTGVARDDSVTTTSVGGEALSGLSVSLDLTRTTVYDIAAELSARQTTITPDAVAWDLSATYGSLGSGNDNFNTPKQVAIDDSGNVHVLDSANTRIIKRDSSGVFISAFGSLATAPVGVAVDSTGNRYVGASTRARAYAPGASSGVYIWSETLDASGHVATDDTYVYFVNSAGDVVYKRLASDGVAVATIGSSGTGDGQFSAPYGIVTDGTHIYVSDTTADRIQKFTVAGSYVTKWGTTGTSDGQLDTPKGLALDSSGNVWVCDFNNDRLQQFSSTGTWLATVTGVTDPDGIAVDGDGSLWVTDSTNDVLRKYTYSGTSPGGYGEVAVAIDGNLSSYIGRGNEAGDVGNAHTYSVQGPASVTVAAYGKRTSETLTLESAVLSAKAVPRR